MSVLSSEVRYGYFFSFGFSISSAAPFKMMERLWTISWVSLPACCRLALSASLVTMSAPYIAYISVLGGIATATRDSKKNAGTQYLTRRNLVNGSTSSTFSPEVFAPLTTMNMTNATMEPSAAKKASSLATLSTPSRNDAM